MSQDQAHETIDPLGAARAAPTLETDPAQESLANALRASFNILRVIIVVLLAAYFLSGWFKVEPGAQGLVVRFGELRVNNAQASEYAGTSVFGSGSHFALPDPFDEKIHLPGDVNELEIDTFLFGRSEKNRGKPLSEILSSPEKLKPGVDGAMYTGDQGLCHGLWRIQYRISKGRNEDADVPYTGNEFVRNVGDTLGAVEPLLQRLAERAVIRAVSGRSVENVLGKGIEGLTREVRQRLQSELNRLETGVRITKVVAETIEPGRVRPAFRRVSEAENEKRRLTDEAEQRRQEILNQAAGPQHKALIELIQGYGAAQATDADPDRLAQLRAGIDAKLDEAGGEVAKLLREAQTRDSQIRESVRRELEEFRTQLETYRRHPRLTKMRLWAQMREDVLSNQQNEVFYVPPFGKIEILINRDPNKAVEADIERYRQGRGYQPQK